MEDSGGWGELHRTKDLHEVRTLATTLAAMDFEVRCLDRHGRAFRPDEEAGEGPYAIHVPQEQCAALADLVDEILDEQAEFDARIEAMESRRRLLNRRLLIAIATLTGLVSAYAVLNSRSWL